MTRGFGEPDVGKPVFSSRGDRLGTVGEVRDEDTARVDHDDSDGLTEKVKEMLGWNDDDDHHDLRRDHVERHDDDGIHLRDR